MSGDILAIIPAAITCILQMILAFAYKEKDFKKEIADLELQNRRAEATTLEGLFESQIALESYAAGDEGGLRDKYFEYVLKIHKHARLDVELDNYRRAYIRACSTTIAVFYIALIFGIGLAVAKLTFSTLPLFIVIPAWCISITLLIIVVLCTFTLRHYIGKVDTIKQRGDLVA